MILDECRAGRPGEICRKALFYSKVESSDLVNDLRNALKQAKEVLVDEHDGPLTEAKRRSVYKRAIELLAYGSLEGFEDVLDHATSSEVLLPRGGYQLLWFLPCLLPLPTELGAEDVWGKQADRMSAIDWIINNKEKIRQWYHENKDNLIWDAEQDRYILKNHEAG